MLTVTAPPEEDPTRLQKHVAATYFAIRWGLAVVAFLFPFWLAIGGWLALRLPLQDSLSAYYHAANQDRTMRTWFVGFLFALGVLLYLYKGFSTKENVALNIAGVATILVAVFPMEWDCGDACARFSIHGAVAIIAFLCIGFVAAFCARDTVRLIRDASQHRKWRRSYYLLAGILWISPLVAFVVSSILDRRSALILFAESLGIVAFSAYWVTKSLELRRSHAELLAMQGSLTRTDTSEPKPEPPKPSA